MVQEVLEAEMSAALGADKGERTAERLGYLPRKADDDCLTELRWLYDRRDLEEARRDLHSWFERWADRYPKLCAWVEDNIEETFTFYRLPRAHHKHLKVMINRKSQAA